MQVLLLVAHSQKQVIVLLSGLIYFYIGLPPLKNFSQYISVILYQNIKKVIMANIKKLTIFVFALLVCSSISGPCPAPNHEGSLFSTRIVAALEGAVIPLEDGVDTKCYNYSLPFQFERIPSIAIAVHDFEVEPSNSLYFFVKPLHSESLGFVPIVVRTQWHYTQWTQISFTFLAEDRVDIETGYYLLDSGYLSSCDSGKSISALLPFQNIYPKNGQTVVHSVFLHGFQIATIKNSDGTRSPLQLQIISTAVQDHGIAVTFSVTTITQVNSIYVSFIAFQKTTLTVLGGSFVFDVTENANAALNYVPQDPIPINFARIYGLSGFLLNFNSQRIVYSSNWDGITFTFSFGEFKSLKYYSFNYIFFTGSLCQDCIGFQIQQNNQCLSQCPIGTFLTADNTCIDCGTGRQWNGTVCITSCPAGQFLNATSGLCECPPTLNWDGASCIPCLSGKVWSKKSKSCQCQKPLTWNGYACARVDPCSNGKVWDVYTFSCQCPESTIWDGEKCRELPQCRGGQVLNSNYQCACPNGFVWSQQVCIYSPCFGGQIWTGSKCTCPVGLNWNGKTCLQCINGQKWDSKSMNCTCESGYRWNGQFCEKSYICSNGRIWNPTYQQCICPESSYWSGYACLQVEKCSGGQYFDSSISKCVCLSGFQWNGKRCIQCNKGRVWNVTTLECTCPPGTVDTRNNGCRLQQSCTGGKQWNQNSWSCECPDTSTWNGKFCILNQCLGGQVWNATTKSCNCLGGKVFINQLCVPPQIACTNGRVWNQFIYACSCPENTFGTPSSCEPVPTCSTGKIYNPLNNQCQCPFGLAEKGQVCIDPKCPVGQTWNGYQCQVINCPPPSFFSKDRCVYQAENKCGFSQTWNGKFCSFTSNQCPGGTKWDQFGCKAVSQCGEGFYSGQSGQCLELPSKCPPGYKWEGSRCSTQGNLCPKGTYSQGSSCLPYQPCKNGFVWDSAYLRCVCPPGTFNNGNRCIQCNNDQKWLPALGCSCPEGTFDTGANCESPDPNKCRVIQNSIWLNNKCSCRPGFTKVGLSCVCYGTQIGDLCDKCGYKPNSLYNERTDTCECKSGFVQIRQFCVQRGQQIIGNDPTKCSVGTYFESSSKACLACPSGCLSCQDCYKCLTCRPQFIYDPATEKCYEHCGDGKKFTLECDDGNNEDGDGCSRDCKVEPGFTCTGGSPDNKDNCYLFRPQRVVIEQVGQIRRSSSIVINLKLNYLPSSLLQAAECSNKCNQILTGSIVSGDNSAVSITSEYLAGTKFIFTLTVEFGRPYIGKFRLNVGVSSSVLKYFGGLGVQPLDITVEPAYLMAVAADTQTDTLK